MVSFKGIGQWCATFMGAELSEGSVVKVSAAGEVSACENSDGFIGVVVCTDKDTATVQLGGFAELSYTGTAPELGCVGLAADDNGGVLASESGEKYWVVDKDEAAQTVMILL